MSNDPQGMGHSIIHCLKYPESFSLNLIGWFNLANFSTNDFVVLKDNSVYLHPCIPGFIFREIKTITDKSINISNDDLKN